MHRSTHTKTFKSSTFVVFVMPFSSAHTDAHTHNTYDAHTHTGDDDEDDEANAAPKADEDKWTELALHEFQTGK
jgi:hypothetical protein